jgi:hypothetical protein
MNGMKQKIHSKLTLPRNKIVQFLVLETIALLISFLIFIVISIVFICIGDYYYYKQHPSMVGEDDLGIGFVGLLSLFFAFVFSMLLAVLVHSYTFRFFQKEGKL